MAQKKIQWICKRSGLQESYNRQKIETAIAKAWAGSHREPDHEKIAEMAGKAEKKLYEGISVEEIQDIVEIILLDYGYYEIAKSYILYRFEHSKKRAHLDQLLALFPVADLKEVLHEVQKDFPEEPYDLSQLLLKVRTFLKDGMSNDERMETLIRAASELTSREAPLWEDIGARLLNLQINQEVDAMEQKLGLHSWYEKLQWMKDHKLLEPLLLETYSQKDIEELHGYLQPERSHLFKHPGLDLLKSRYLITDHQGSLLERVQEMFMGIAMHLAVPEEDSVYWAKRFYDMLSTLKVTMATPTMANARKPFHQMSSCFIDTVDDSLTGIYKSVSSFAQVSKFGGGMGMYFGKVRSSGSDIRGFEGAAGGVIPWIRLVNDTAVAVDQLGVRSGAAAVYLDVWHKDLPEFLQLRTNNGDDRKKAHDIFPAVCFPDLFWYLVKNNIDAAWNMMDPHEILMKKGYCLEDCYGLEWEQKYLECVADPAISKRTMPVKEIVRMLIKSMVETGTPFVFNRDAVNNTNPNSHKGMIYSSNLCTEIAQNMSSMEVLPPQIVERNGRREVVETTIPGNFVVCNLASLSLAKIDTDNDDELREVVFTVVRALDNVIDLNYYALPFAELTNQQYRAIGLGTSGYHHLLAKKHIPFESERHLEFMDDLYERINFHALAASSALAREKGVYDFFEGSEYQTGEYFKKRDYVSDRWKALAAQISRTGLRNGYLMAIAPTSSTSILAGTTPGVDPILKKFFMEEKKGSLLTRVAPDLSPETFWYYKNAHLMDQNWVIDSAAVRQRHIDQGQSVNLYITNDYTFRKILDLYLRAWEKGVKTIYYVRSKSLEVEECESCSA
ncbi:MAG: ribonucleoside-diphosphate reductase subunit alpha [Erysipelotrichaceae bacterium]|nr:ribonucleoside-diphosphate reductase subunit alpha [Erysipelotrichaceae bacterium]